ncbi:hypothetical protein [Salininema proteolyticum]|uniref:Uncharacterized protein n=1 Tax=Salininema proteolyticum TaxID=1607685 RepID=A0ABV8TZ36_9ACTN
MEQLRSLFWGEEFEQFVGTEVADAGEQERSGRRSGVNLELHVLLFGSCLGVGGKWAAPVCPVPDTIVRDRSGRPCEFGLVSGVVVVGQE